MLRILKGRSLLMANYFKYSSKPVGKSSTELIFLKKEDDVSSVAPICVPMKTIADPAELKCKEIPRENLTKPHAEPSQKKQTNLEKFYEIFDKNCQWILKNLKVNRNFDEIPGPVILKTTAKIFKVLPFLGQQTSSAILELFLFSDNIFHFFKITSPSYYLRQQFGRVIHLPGLFGGNFILLTHPDYLQLVLNNEKNFRSCFDSLNHYSKKTIKTSNLISVKEELDKYLTTEISVHENFNTTTIDFIEKIKKSRDKDDEVPNNFSEDINKWSLECIWTVIFSTKTNFFDPVVPPEQHLFMDSLMSAVTTCSSCERGFQLWRLIDTKNWIKLCENLKAIDCMIDKNICKKCNPLIENLLRSGVTKEELKMIVREIFVVGVSLSSSALIYSLLNLAKNPTKQKHLFDEIIKVLPNANSKITQESLKNIPYLNGFILESLRVNSPIKFLKRSLDQDLKIDNFLIPKTSQVFVAHQLSNSSDEFFENSQNFEPKRWLDKKLKPWNGLGCIEEKLVELKMKIVLVHLLRNFIVQYDHGEISSGRSCISLPTKSLNFSFIDRL